MNPFHQLLRGYFLAPDHPAKLRLYGWLKTSAMFRSAIVRTDTATYRLDLQDYLQHEIFANGAYEPASFDLFLSLLNPGDCVVDVGANVGQYALGGASRVGPRGRVLAIEPNPHNCEQLMENRRLSGAVDVVDVFLTAISDDPGLMDFDVPHPAAQGLSREKAKGSHSESFAIHSVKLGDLLARCGMAEVAVLKIDVEGAEMAVLRSLFETSDCRPRNILFEFIPESFETAAGLPDYISDQGYEILGIDGAPYSGGRPIEENLWARRL